MQIIAIYLAFNLIVGLVMLAVTNPILALSFIGYAVGVVLLLLLPSMIVSLWRWAFPRPVDHWAECEKDLRA